MKQDIHPTVHPVIFIDTSCGAEFKTLSTRKSNQTREIDGVTYYEISIEISSASHPFYTGKQVLLDAAGRLDRFKARQESQEEAATARQGKKAKRAKRAATKTQEKDAK
ncbi:type B 50S ribosomal protein L31 [Patescibacteria group bacterium]|nr:type B 50S ribosomal protein L31 [Patescibacteria group bacterium]MBU1721185.1 type B 50S ribosomal protein L31 [Patescibacteria group bacterium]MBU1901107.1 type B 50S ribosomal protein L31 [Patescibacteria group bacterium]